MIRLEPSKRYTIPQILSHAWLKETNEEDSEEEDTNNTANANQQDNK
jgi:hypothetical protein